jgi:glycosyltransferase involved in cell wall biosynthesis
MEILREHPEYKVFHSHQELNLWTLKYAEKAGIPCRIAHSHNAKTVVNLKFFFFLYEKLFIKRHCTDMFMCSTLAGEWSYGKKAVQDGRVRMSKNGIEVERFRYNEEVRREVRRELNVEDKIVIGHAGRFMQQKNHMFLMDIFRKIHDRNPDTVLLLCGEGRLEEDIRRKVKELELEDHVRFLGVRPDMDRMYQGFDLFLLPSLWEGLPVVGIEAQTSGLPILMSDVITPEVEVTPCVKKLSLKTSPEVWAQTALDMIREHQRQDEYQRIVDAGFDIRETAKWWQNYYLEKYREENEN